MFQNRKLPEIETRRPQAFWNKGCPCVFYCLPVVAIIRHLLKSTSVRVTLNVKFDWLLFDEIQSIHDLVHYASVCWANLCRAIGCCAGVCLQLAPGGCYAITMTLSSMLCQWKPLAREDVWQCFMHAKLTTFLACCQCSTFHMRCCFELQPGQAKEMSWAKSLFEPFPAASLLPV